MIRCLVTGAAGFIGSALAHRLILEGNVVTVIDNLSTGFKSAIPENAKFIEGDCGLASTYESLENEKFDVIFHLAGQSSGEISFDNPIYDIRTNTVSTLLLLEYAQRVKCGRFIYASTMSVYGDRVKNPVVESAAASPISFYGVGKLASENYLRLFEKNGIRTTALRLFNVYGPGQNMSNLKQGMVSIYLAQMLYGNHIQVKGAKTRFRDLIYIDDVVEAFVRCLDRHQSAGQVLNVGTGVKTHVYEIINYLTRHYEEEVSVEYAGSTKGDVFGIFADVTLLNEVLGYWDRVSLDDGIKATVSYHTKEV